MADSSIQPNEVGAYEISIRAGTTRTVQLVGPQPDIYSRANVLVHSAETPVYVFRGTKVAAKEPKSVIVMAGAWAEIFTGETQTIAITCESDAVVSVTRI